LCDGGKKALNDFVAPLYCGHFFSPGSSDVGDVSWQTPTAQINTVTFPSGAPGHSWQNVSCGATSIGDKGLLFAGKVLAATAVDLLEQPALLAAARAEFDAAARKAGGYVCPIPPDAKPVTVEI